MPTAQIMNAWYTKEKRDTQMKKSLRAALAASCGIRMNRRGWRALWERRDPTILSDNFSAIAAPLYRARPIPPSSLVQSRRVDDPRQREGQSGVKQLRPALQLLALTEKTPSHQHLCPNHRITPQILRFTSARSAIAIDRSCNALVRFLHRPQFCQP